MDWSAVTIIICVDVLMAMSLFLPLVIDVFFLLPIGAMAVSAYAFGYFSHKGPSWWLVALLAVLAGGATALVGGAFVIRMRSFAAAIATLAMVEIIQNFFVNFTPTGGAEGLTGVPLISTLWLVLALTVVAIAVLSFWYFSRSGVKARATGNDEVAAECSGINTRMVRLGVYGASGLLAGLGGILSVGYTGYVSPNQFGFDALNSYLVPAIFGGLGSPVGPVIGGMVTTGIPQFVVSLQNYAVLISAAVVLTLIVVRRGGLVTRSRTAERLVAVSWKRGGRRKEDWDKAGDAGAALKVEGLRKRFSGVTAVADVSFRANPGEMMAIIGPNGAGKTTLLNLLTGVEPFDSGRVEIDGRAVRVMPPHRAARLGVVRTFQNLRLFSNLLVGDNISARSPIRRAKAGAAQAGVDGLFAARIQSLPYGIQRRVEIARALALKPRLLLLDEPTAGMTAEESDDIAALLRHLRQKGLTIIVVEHNLRFIMGLVDRVLVLDHGEVLALGTPQEVQSDPEVLKAYFGVADAGDPPSAQSAEPGELVRPTVAAPGMTKPVSPKGDRP